MKFVTKEQWGSSQSKEATKDSHPIGSTLGVTLHWVGPGMGFPWDHSTCADKVRGIERHHEYGNGWGDIAYNLLACPHGYVFEGRGAGVRSAANGGTQSNEDWYAVCYLGGLGDGFSPDGDEAMVDAVRYLREKGNAGPRVNGHRDHKGTDCPGDTIYAWLKTADFSTPTKDYDMANYRDWPEADKKAFVADIAKAVASTPVEVPGDERSIPLSKAIHWVWEHARRASKGQ